jgi:hypothetical protein
MISPQRATEAYRGTVAPPAVWPPGPHVVKRPRPRHLSPRRNPGDE